MRYITADYIFPISSPPVKNGIIKITDGGEIVDIINKQETANNKQETYTGIICPGFINAHCHLELSYMKGMITERTGMTGFISELLQKRNSVGKEKKYSAIVEAENEMIRNGIIAVGDISNDATTFEKKSEGKLFYHTFIELFDLNPDKAEDAFHQGLQLAAALKGGYSLVPHAPYTVSAKLLNLINSCAYENNSLITIHNQESEEENEMFLSKTGKLVELFEKMNIDLNWFKATGFKSLPSALVHLSKFQKILLVHNTYTTVEDIRWAHKFSNQVYWCFCPNANLYIENSLPDFKIFMDENCKIVVGTDSLASNHQLSILEELKTISEAAPKIALSTLLTWATKNGADFFNIFNKYGTLEKGKTPGINLIENVDLEKLSLTKESRVKKII